MGDTKRPKSDSALPDNLERNPGIGTSKGGRDEIEGESTVEGDRDNDTNPGDGISKHDRGRDDGLS